MFDSFNFTKRNYSNIIFLKNTDIIKRGLEATSIMPYCDALICDYSSAAFDYMLLDRPIFYFIGDEKNMQIINSMALCGIQLRTICLEQNLEIKKN